MTKQIMVGSVAVGGGAVDGHKRLTGLYRVGIIACAGDVPGQVRRCVPDGNACQQVPQIHRGDSFPLV